MVKVAAVGARGAVGGALMMVMACALIAATMLLAKALGRGVDGPALHPLQVSAGRFGFALLALLPLLAIHRPSFRGAAWPVHGARVLCGWAGASCLFAAAAAMPLADATAISFLSPLVTMLLAIPLLGERVGAWRWGAAGVAMLGTMVLIQPGSAAFQPAALIALAAAGFMGMEAILIKRLSTSEPLLRILAISNGLGVLIAGAAAAPFWVAPSASQWGLMALLGLAMVTAQSLFIRATQRDDLSFVIPFFYSTLVFAGIYDLLVFGDMPSLLSAAGATLIVAAALVLAWREQRERTKARLADPHLG